MRNPQSTQQRNGVEDGIVCSGCIEEITTAPESQTGHEQAGHTVAPHFLVSEENVQHCQVAENTNQQGYRIHNIDQLPPHF